MEMLMLLSIFVVYLVMQAYAAMHLRGGWRWTSLLPLLPMALVLAMTVGAYRQGSNIWPVPLILASPPACIFVIAVLAVHRYVGLRPWAKWATMVFALLLGYELVAYTLALVAERRSHGDPTPWVSQAPDSIMTWGVPFLLIAVSAI